MRISSAEPAVAPNLAPPPGNPRFALVDSLRAIAALLVFAGHTVTETTSLAVHPERFVWATNVAYEGVALFFLISGFLLYRPFVAARAGGRAVPLPDYARRRVLRIVPAYWAALSIFLALGLVSGVDGGNWWVFYGFGQIYTLRTLGGGIGAGWTLCIEVSFYAVLPVFAWLASRLSGPRAPLRGDVVLLAVLGAAALVLRSQLGSLSDLVVASTLPGTFIWFALGMSLAVASADARAAAVVAARAARLPGWPAGAWALALVLFLALHELGTAAASVGTAAVLVGQHVLYGLIALLLLAPAIFHRSGGGPVIRLLRQRWLAWIGLVSYALYLYHTIVIDQLHRFAVRRDVVLRYPFVAVLGLAVSLGCAAASYYGLERPLMRLGRGRVRGTATAV